MQQALHTGAIDLAQQVLHLVGADTTGNILWRTRLTRQALRPFIAQLPPVRIGIDAWGGAPDWARRFR
jgi:transposase